MRWMWQATVLHLIKIRLRRVNVSIYVANIWQVNRRIFSIFYLIKKLKVVIHSLKKVFIRLRLKNDPLFLSRRLIQNAEQIIIIPTHTTADKTEILLLSLKI